MREIRTRNKQEILRRNIAFVFVLFIIALGTSMSIRANLGSSPISCPPYVLSCIPNISISFGTFVFCMYFLFVVIQILLLRRDFKKIQLLQLLVSLLFGVYSDISMWITSYIQFDNSATGYILRWIQLVIGGTILAYGIALEVRCDVLLLPGEGLPLTISKVINVEFGKVKICSDTALVIIAIIFCYYFFGIWEWKLIGVGTLFSTIYVGYMVKVFTKRVSWLDSLIIPATNKL